MKKRGSNTVPLRRKAKPPGTVRISWAPRVRKEPVPTPSPVVPVSLDWLTTVLLGSPSLNAFSAAMVTNGWVTLDNDQKVYIGDDGKVYPSGPGKPPAGEPKGKSTPAAGTAEGTLSRLEREIAGGERERGYLLGPDGKVIAELSQRGEATEINLTREQEAQAKDAIFTHNHPAGTAPSVGDFVQAARLDMREMRVVTKIGDDVRVHSLRRPEGGWPSHRRLEETQGEANRTALEKTDAEAAARPFANVREARRAFQSNLAREMAERLGIPYTVRDLAPTDNLATNGWITLGDDSTNPGQRIYIDDKGGFRPGGPGSAPTGYAPKDREDGNYKPIQKEAPPPPREEPKPSDSLPSAGSPTSGQENAKGGPQPRYGSTVRDKAITSVHASIDKQNHLSDDAKKEYKDAIVRVMSGMTDKAIRAMGEGVKAFRWHADTKSLTAEFDRVTGRPTLEYRVTNGYYSTTQKTVVLDGQTEKTRAPGMGGNQKNTHGTYAHELTHAIDYGTRFSRLPEWKAAFQKDIVGDRTRPGRLSDYARTSAVEGFAEFGRALYGSDVSRASLKADFPEAYSFFAKHGLIQE